MSRRRTAPSTPRTSGGTCAGTAEAVTELRPALSGYLHQRLIALQDGFRHNIAIVGPVGSGKTVLVQQLLATSAAQVVKLHCALQSDSMRAFLKRWTLAVLRAALDQPSASSVDVLLEQADRRVPRTAAAIRALDRYEHGRLPAEAFSHALDVVPILHQELQRPCVLVLDEFLALEELGLTHAIHELGKRVMTWPFALFVLISSAQERARDVLRERLHVLFGQFEVLPMGSVDTASVMSWMEQELPGAESVQELLRFLVHWTQLSPWYATVLLKRTRELLRLQRQRRVTHAVLLQAAWDVLGSVDGGLHHWCAGRLQRLVPEKHGPLARQALIRIAGGARTLHTIGQQCGGSRRLSQALHLLASHDLIERKGTCWLIPDQVLACWLNAIAGPQDQGLPTSQERFEGVLKDMWLEWQAATTRPLAARMTDLFERFRDETVSLDHKTGRLPPFTSFAHHRVSPDGGTYVVADGPERRWCCLIHDRPVTESDITAFEQFCRAQAPRPARKVVVIRHPLELNATLLAKEADMWVWRPDDLNLLFLLYGQPVLG